MEDNKAVRDEKSIELLKYRSLVLATIDYGLENDLMHVKTDSFDSEKHFQGLKEQTEEHFKKGRLGRLKQWFRDLTEMYIEGADLKFNTYLREKAGYDIDIFKAYFERIDKIVLKGKITSDNQFYDINIMVDQLCQTDRLDLKRIELLNNLLAVYEQRRTLRGKD